MNKNNVVYNKSHAHRIDLRKESFRDWKNSFLRKFPWLLNIPEDYISDKFNIYGLQNDFSFLGLCCDIICGKADLSCIPQSDKAEISKQLPQVYGMIHARFILAPAGLSALNEKYKRCQYGTCPRFNCQNEPLLPIGVSSQMNQDSVKAFCPCCREVFYPRPQINLDGAYFGPNAAHIFIDEMKIKSHRCFRPYSHNAFGFRLRSSIFQNQRDDQDDYDYENENEDE